MPAPVDHVVIPGHPQQLSTHAIVLCCACFAATFVGASAITLSLSLVLRADAGSSAYWVVSLILLAIWFATLIHMNRIALATVLAER